MTAIGQKRTNIRSLQESLKLCISHSELSSLLLTFLLLARLTLAEEVPAPRNRTGVITSEQALCGRLRTAGGREAGADTLVHTTGSFGWRRNPQDRECAGEKGTF